MMSEEERAAHMAAAMKDWEAKRSGDPDLADLHEHLEGHDAEVKELLSTFPEAERPAAQAGIYRDAAGTLRTRHGRLRRL